MRIAITGSSGFLGSAATSDLTAAGHHVVPLVRAERGGGVARGDVSWDPATGAIDARALGDVDVVLHLAGENIAGGRWSPARKRAIADSRGPATERLCRTLAALPHRPRTLIAASAIGFYGDRGDEELDERSPAGTGFLAHVTSAWEAATRPATEAGIRVVNLRFGVVLDRRGGALRRMMLPFRIGVGGRLGHGRQWMSWIALSDLLRVLRFVLERSYLTGPIVAASPMPVTNRQLTRALGDALHRPTVLPVPAFVLRLLLGELADETLLASQRARPARLLDSGFHFAHAHIASALHAILHPKALHAHSESPPARVPSAAPPTADRAAR